MHWVLIGWPQRGNGRALDAGHGPQHQPGHRHQGTGVAGGDRGVRVTLLHGLQRQPHGRALAAAQSLARLVVHADDAVGMYDFRSGLEVRIALELGVDARHITEKDEADSWIALKRESRARDDDRRSVIAAHGIERDCSRRWHLVRLPADVLELAAASGQHLP